MGMPLSHSETRFLMLPISVCIITKNEEQHLESCLKKLTVLPWEIIVTDTGSTDNTLSIAKKYTCQVHHFAWNNDFSAARNYCISKASHDWILNIDSDEYFENNLSEEELNAFFSFFCSNPFSAGLINIINPHSPVAGSLTSTEPVARFFHRKYYAYQGIIHEQPLPINGAKPQYQSFPLSFYHVGYADETRLNLKASRNIALLKKALAADTANPYLYYQLGQSYYITHSFSSACEAFEKGLSFDVDPDAQYVQNMVVSYGYCLLNLREYEKALQFEGIYDAFCSYADFVFLMGLIYMNNALFHDAVKQFQKAATLTHFSVNGTNSFLAHYNAGVIYECTNDLKNAQDCYQKCGDYPPALERLKGLRKH